GDPEAVNQGQASQGRGTMTVLPGPLHPDIEGLQSEEVPLGILRVVVPVRDVPLAEKQARSLELPAPDGAIRPGCFQPGTSGRIKRQGRPTIAVVESLDGVVSAVPTRVVVPLP